MNCWGLVQAKAELSMRSTVYSAEMWAKSALETAPESWSRTSDPSEDFGV